MAALDDAVAVGVMAARPTTAVDPTASMGDAAAVGLTPPVGDGGGRRLTAPVVSPTAAVVNAVAVGYADGRPRRYVGVSGPCVQPCASSWGCGASC